MIKRLHGLADLPSRSQEVFRFHGSLHAWSLPSGLLPEIVFSGAHGLYRLQALDLPRGGRGVASASRSSSTADWVEISFAGMTVDVGRFGLYYDRFLYHFSECAVGLKWHPVSFPRRLIRSLAQTDRNYRLVCVARTELYVTSTFLHGFVTPFFDCERMIVGFNLSFFHITTPNKTGIFVDVDKKSSLPST